MGKEPANGPPARRNALPSFGGDPPGRLLLPEGDGTLSRMRSRRVRLIVLTVLVAGVVIAGASGWMLRRHLFRTSWQRADEAFGACIFGEGDACGRVIPAHLTSCEDGRAEHCHHAAAFILGGASPGRGPREALRLFRRGCSLGRGESCFAAARMLEGGQGEVRQDRPGALVAYREACNRGFREGCHRAGLMLARKVAAPESLGTAEALIGVACAKGAQLACYNYLVVRSRVDKNLDFATRALLRRCKLSSLRCDPSRLELREPSPRRGADQTLWRDLCAACGPEADPDASRSRRRANP